MSNHKRLTLALLGVVALAGFFAVELVSLRMHINALRRDNDRLITIAAKNTEIIKETVESIGILQKIVLGKAKIKNGGAEPVDKKAQEAHDDFMRDMAVRKQDLLFHVAILNAGNIERNAILKAMPKPQPANVVLIDVDGAGIAAEPDWQAEIVRVIRQQREWKELADVLRELSR